MNLKGRDIGDLRLPSEFIVPTAELRTDLDDFSRVERDALIYHAYTLMKSQLAEHCKKGLESFFPRLQDASAPPEEKPCDKVSEESKLFDWPPPFVKACDPKCAKSSEARRWISGFIWAGRGLVFRDVLRFPWIFGPILALFMITATFFGLSLTGTLAEPSDGMAVRSIAQAIGRAVISVTPDVNIPGVINLKNFREGFEYNGEYWPALLLVSKLVVLALTFYVALWLYYEFKRWTRLGEHYERWKLNSFVDKKGRFDKDTHNC
jgi:hypothetical protein